MNFAKSWGYGGVYMTNMFAFVATKPSDMKASADPVGKDNDYWLTTISKQAGIILATWGNVGVYRNRSVEVRNLIQDMKCLKINKSGEPSHPLYLSKQLKPVIYQPNK